MSTSTQFPKTVNSNCLLVDYCAEIVLRPLLNARFELVCDPDKFQAMAKEPVLIPVRATASNCGFKPKTLYNWIESGKLRDEHGLQRWGRRWRIEWVVFKACFDRGDFASCS